MTETNDPDTNDPDTNGGDTHDADSATSELLSAINHDLRQLVREELQRTRSELGDSIKAGRRAMILFGAAGMFGALGMGTSAGFVVRLLDGALPRPVAALLASGLFGAAAGGLGYLGLTELRQGRDQLAAS